MIYKIPANTNRLLLSFEAVWIPDQVGHDNVSPETTSPFPIDVIPAKVRSQMTAKPQTQKTRRLAGFFLNQQNSA
ncbi:MAG: hypothetical protein EOM37_03290 [Proteobacteria bacterium]|nr:hypothetical protein [Pseudomonadota bacterium]